MFERIFPSAIRARAFGMYVAAVVVGFSICLAMYALRSVDFEPMQRLVDFDDRIYDILFPLPKIAGPGVAPVIFVDVTDEAMRQYGEQPGSRTPRPLLADLVHRIRSLAPAAIFLDFDFRDRTPADTELREELRRADQPPVLLPQGFRSNIPPNCELDVTKASARSDTLVPSAFDDVARVGAVQFVHSIAETGDYGLVESVCSNYRISAPNEDQWTDLSAAMVRAFEFARPDIIQTAENNLGESARRRIRINWRVRKEATDLHSADGRVIFLRLASPFLSSPADRLEIFKGAIVIVGSTHAGADDTRVVPIGEIPGALIHANLALDLQAPLPSELSLWFQLLIDLIFISITTLAPTVIIYIPALKSEMKSRINHISYEIIIMAKEFFLLIVITVIFLVSLFTISNLWGTALYAWRFACLTSCAGAFIAFFVEFVSAVSRSAEIFARRLVEPKSTTTG